MRRLSSLLVVNCLLLIGASSGMGPRDLKLPAGKTFIHKHSGFEFPTRFKDFKRTTGSVYDDAEKNISVGYNCIAIGAWADIYVYPTNGTTVAYEFDSVREEMKAAPQYSNIKVIAESPIRLTRNNHDFDGRSGKYSYTIEIDKGLTMDVHSQTYLFVLGENFIKFRITYDPRQQTAVKAIEAFVDAVEFPKTPATQPR